MKFKLILSLTFLHFIFLAKSQDFILNYKLNDNIRNYYDKIYHAENNLLVNQYKEAIICYDSAFKINKKPFAKEF